MQEGEDEVKDGETRESQTSPLKMWTWLATWVPRDKEEGWKENTYDEFCFSGEGKKIPDLLCAHNGLIWWGGGVEGRRGAQRSGVES